MLGLQGLNFRSCVWRAVSGVLLAIFSLYVHTRGLKLDSFHFLLTLKDDEVIADKYKLPGGGGGGVA